MDLSLKRFYLFLYFLNLLVSFYYGILQLKYDVLKQINIQMFTTYNDLNAKL